CEARPQSIRLAVYLCAFLLRDGESVWRHESPAPSEGTARSVLSPPNLRVNEKERSLDLDPAVIPNGFYSGCSPDDIADAAARWRPQPLAPLLTELSLSKERFGSVPRAYISCKDDHVIPFPAQQQMCRLTPCEVNLVLNAGHSPFLSHPGDLARLLESL
ncbi:MAG TPA: alpha/beta fold hydrolase, partial [Actinomycetota bacterium]|nr:alpha/beta fold hydrolase [Actinomycetota bacterium]